MQYPQLPNQFTAEVLKALSLKQLGHVIARFGFVQTYRRLGLDDLCEIWLRETPSSNFGEFLNQVGVPITQAEAQRTAKS